MRTDRKRFDYVLYDDTANAIQKIFKEKFVELDDFIDALKEGRAKSLAITKLEECYMWIGKAIRDEQVARNYIATLQEERKDG